MEKLYQIWKKFGKNFEEGGKLSWLSSFYDAFDTFLFTPQTTAKRNGTHIHDGSDSKRTMILVVMALVPAMLLVCSTSATSTCWLPVSWQQA